MQFDSVVPARSLAPLWFAAVAIAAALLAGIALLTIRTADEAPEAVSQAADASAADTAAQGAATAAKRAQTQDRDAARTTAAAGATAGSDAVSRGTAVAGTAADPAAKPALRSRIGEGTFAVGVDVRPGIYRTGGGATACYWARLRGGSSDDIIENSLGTGGTVATLEAGEWFETSGCDTWYRQQR